MYSETNTSGNSTVSGDSKTGFVGGAVYNISVLSVIAIEPGLVYSMRGGQGGSMGSESKESIDYLAIPVHAKLKLPGVPFVSPFILAGVNVGFLVSAKDDDGTTTQDVSSEKALMDLGPDLGIGVELPLTALVPYLEYVYDMGLTGLEKNPQGSETIKTNGSEIKVGVRFKL